MEDIRLEDFSEDMICFINFVGIDMFIDICDRFGTQRSTVKKESVLRASRNREIKSMCSRYSTNDIAKKFGITKRQVENIIKA